jgi:hypothetical protein
MGKLMHMQHPRTEIRKALNKILDGLVWHQDIAPPQQPGTNPAFRDNMKQILRTTWSMGHEVQDDDPYGPMFKFFNGNLLQPVPLHYCQSRQCCKSKKHAIKRAKDIVYKCFFAHGPPQFQPARWMKQLPALVWWCALMAFHGLGRSAILSAGLKDDEADADVNDEAGLLRKLQAGRIRAGRKWMEDEKSIFNLMLVVVLLSMLDDVAKMLAHTSDVILEGAKKQQEWRKRQQSRRRRRGLPDGDADGDDDYEDKGMLDVMRAVHQV